MKVQGQRLRVGWAWVLLMASSTLRAADPADCKPSQQPVLSSSARAAIQVMDQFNQNAPKGTFGCRTVLDTRQELAVLERIEAFSQGLRGELSSQLALSKIEAEFVGSKEQIALQQSATLALLSDLLKKRFAAKALTGSSLTSAEVDMMAKLSGMSVEAVAMGFEARKMGLEAERKALFAPLNDFSGEPTQVTVDSQGRPDLRDFDFARALREPRLLGALSSYFGAETLMQIADPNRRRAVVFDGYVFLPLGSAREDLAECDRIRATQMPPRNSQSDRKRFTLWQKEQLGCQMRVLTLDQYEKDIESSLNVIRERVPQYLRKSKQANADWSAYSSDTWDHIFQFFGAEPTTLAVREEWKDLGETIDLHIQQLQKLGLEPTAMKSVYEAWSGMSQADAAHLTRGIQKLDSAMTAVKASASILAGYGILSGLSSLSSVGPIATAALKAGLAATATSFASDAIRLGIGIASDSIAKGQNPICTAADELIAQSGAVFQGAAKKAAVTAVLGGLAAVPGVNGVVSQVVQGIGPERMTALSFIKSGGEVTLAVAAGISGAQECIKRIQGIKEGSAEAIARAEVAIAARECSKAGLDIFKGLKKSVREFHSVTEKLVKMNPSDPELAQALAGLEKARKLFEKDPDFLFKLKSNPTADSEMKLFWKGVNEAVGLIQKSGPKALELISRH